MEILLCLCLGQILNLNFEAILTSLQDMILQKLAALFCGDFRHLSKKKTREIIIEQKVSVFPLSMDGTGLPHFDS